MNDKYPIAANVAEAYAETPGEQLSGGSSWDEPGAARLGIAFFDKPDVARSSRKPALRDAEQEALGSS